MTCIESQKNWFTAIRRTTKCFPAILRWKKLVPSYFEPDKHCRSYLEREKCGSLLYGDPKIYFTLLGARKNIMTSI